MRARRRLRRAKSSRRARLAAAGLCIVAVAFALGAFIVVPAVVAGALARYEDAVPGRVAQADRIRADPFRLRVVLSGVAFADPDTGAEMTADDIAVNFGLRTLFRRAFFVDVLAADGLRLRVERRGDGPQLADLIEAAVPADRPVSLERLRVTAGRVELADRDGERELVLDGLELAAGPLSTQRAAAGSLELEVDDVAGASLRIDGELTLSEPASRGRITADGADLGQLRHWLATDVLTAGTARLEAGYAWAAAPGGGMLELRDAALHVAGARIDAGGGTRIDAEALEGTGEAEWRERRLRAAGDAELTAFSLEDTGSGDGRRLDADAVEVAAATVLAEAGTAPSLTAEALRLVRPSVRLAGRDAAARMRERLLGPLVDPAGDDVSQRPRLAAARIEVVDGMLALDGSFAAIDSLRAERIDGVLARVEERPGEIVADVEARLADGGEAVIVAREATAAGAARRDVRLRIGGAAASAFAPIIESVLGFEPGGGRIDAELDYRVRGAVLDGTARLAGEDLAFADGERDGPALEPGETALAPGTADLALALLTDSGGRIELDVPLASEARGARPSPAAALAEGLREALSDAAAAPFGALGMLVGLDADTLRSVTFPAGGAAPGPAAERTLDGLGRALGARPRVGLSVTPRADRARDRDTLAARQIELHVTLATAGSEFAARPRPVDFDSPRHRDVLDEFAGERLSDERLETIRSYFTRDEDGRVVDAERSAYYEALFDALVENETISDAALMRLARYRAQSIVEALAEAGVERSRVEILEPDIAGEPPERPATGVDPADGVGLPLDVRALSASGEASPGGRRSVPLRGGAGASRGGAAALLRAARSD